MATNEILQFASQDTGSNLLTQSEYEGDAQRTIGHQPGIARSRLENKVLRQASLMASGLAQFIVDNNASSVTDSMSAQDIADALSATVGGIVVPGANITIANLNVNALDTSTFSTQDVTSRFAINIGSQTSYITIAYLGWSGKLAAQSSSGALECGVKITPADGAPTYACAIAMGPETAIWTTKYTLGGSGVATISGGTVTAKAFLHIISTISTANLINCGFVYIGVKV